MNILYRPYCVLQNIAQCATNSSVNSHVTRNKEITAQKQEQVQDTKYCTISVCKAVQQNAKTNYGNKCHRPIEKNS